MHTIGITDCSKYAIYEKWILAYQLPIKIIKLGYRLNNLSDIVHCQGIVLSGGEDVHPRFYNKPDYLPYCYTDDVDEKRDEFEWKILQYTEQNKVPVLGICRGLQFFNVFLGGTLVPDIPTWQKNGYLGSNVTAIQQLDNKPISHAKLANGQDSYHSIHIAPNSQLHALVGATQGIVNSNHHQCADHLGKGLVISATSEEGIIEALERPNSPEKPYICLVQWHPERLNQPESSLSDGIRRLFLEKIAHI